MHGITWDKASLQFCLVMELCHKGNLMEVLQQEKPEWTQRLDIARGVKSES